MGETAAGAGGAVLEQVLRRGGLGGRAGAVHEGLRGHEVGLAGRVRGLGGEGTCLCRGGLGVATG